MLQKERFWGRADAPARADVKPGNKPALAAAVANAGVLHREGLRAPGTTEGSKLTVGPGIQLKGVEIKDCDTLIVAGHVEASMDSRAIEIAAAGSYAGHASIDIAEIHGRFSGEITVRRCLTIRATGKVSGKIRYQKLVVEEGGELAGDLQTLALEGPPGAAAHPLP
jgi:cytoskeletal protein CcmA (bactofilin family)